MSRAANPVLFWVGEEYNDPIERTRGREQDTCSRCLRIVQPSYYVKLETVFEDVPLKLKNKKR